jgi:hypothetical protein
LETALNSVDIGIRMAYREAGTDYPSGLHLLPEDSGPAIAEALLDWIPTCGRRCSPWRSF